MEPPDQQRPATPGTVLRGEWRWRGLALFLTVVGARWWLIERYTAAVPYWDQWDGIGGFIIKPWLEGNLHWGDLFTPHNEHRIFLTRVLSLALFVANGQWDNLLECSVNALFAGFSAVCLAAVQTSFLGREHRRVVFLATALYFVLPFGWENTLNGFQSQNYFLNFFSLLAIWGLGFRGAGSRGWWTGFVALILASLSMATGFLAAATVGIVVAARVASDRRRPIAGETATVLLCVAAAVAGWTTRVEVPAHEPLRVHGLTEFFWALLRFMAWPVYRYPLCGLLAVTPVVVLALVNLWRIATRRAGEAPTAPPAAAWLCALGGWVFLQTAAMAYGRGGNGVPPACRYMDLLAFGPFVNFLAWFALADGVRGTRRRVATLACAAVWTALLIAGLWAETDKDFRSWLPWYQGKVRQGEQNLRGYLATGDSARFLAGKPPEESVYPNPTRLVSLLDDTLRPTLPADVRPALILQPEDGGVRSAFVPGDYPPMSGLPAEIPCWGSYRPDGGVAQGTFRARIVSSTALPYLRFSFAGDLDREGMRFSLRGVDSNDGRDWHPPRPIGEHWHVDYLRKPGREFTLEAADGNPAGWFAFSAPVEVGFWSYWTGFLLRRSVKIFAVGVGLFCVVEIVSVFRRTRRTAGKP